MAEGIRDDLQRAGIRKGDVSLCYLEEPAPPRENRMQGARVEGYVKVPARKLIATGHFEWGLKGPVTTHASGAVTRVLAAMGMPREEARRYEKQVRDGAVLLSVFCGSELLSKKAKLTLQRAGVDELASVGRGAERERAEVQKD